MNTTPIMEFKDTQEAVACLKEWQERLGLGDWIIKVMLVEPHEFILKDVDGECEYTKTCKAATIRIMYERYYGDRISKYCVERILVHELLHCKLAMLETNDEGFNELLHQTQEDIARALVMAKYGITRAFFSNIKYEEDKPGEQSEVKGDIS
jgi:hypothetical protein